MQGNVVHLQDITDPKPPQTVDANLVGTTDNVADTGESAIPQSSDFSVSIEPENQEICETEMAIKAPAIDVQEHTLEWTDGMAEALLRFFSQDALKQLEEMYLQGQASLADGTSSNPPVPSSSDNKDGVQPSHQDPPQKDKKEKNQRGRDNRKKKTKDFDKKHRLVDDRKVFSEVCFRSSAHHTLELIHCRPLPQKKIARHYTKSFARCSVASWKRKPQTVNVSVLSGLTIKEETSREVIGKLRLH